MAIFCPLWRALNLWLYKLTSVHMLGWMVLLTLGALLQSLITALLA